MQQIERFNRNVRREYPLVETAYDVSVQLQVTEPENAPKAVSEQKFSNFRLTSPNGTDLIMVNQTLFACVNLAPYSGWDVFLAKFQNNYERFRKLAGHLNLTRAATRYINRIDVPRQENQEIRTEDYVLIEPCRVEGISQVTDFRTQFIGNVPEIDGQVIVNAGTMPSPLIDHVSFLVDIDLFRVKNLPRRDADVWELLAGLRVKKNELFEAFITERARELFDRV
jgi:uncharacterized protein (TIGR04255 family)